MSKYIKHFCSKFEFPTKVVKTSQFDGTLSIGHKRALPVLEKKLGRPLHKDTKIVTRGNCWVFLEPKGDKNAS